MVIIDCEPAKMQPVEVTDLNMPTIQGAVLIDNVGWLVGGFDKNVRDGKGQRQRSGASL